MIRPHDFEGYIGSKVLLAHPYTNEQWRRTNQKGHRCCSLKKACYPLYVVTVVGHRGNVVKVDKEETIKKKISH